MANKRTVTLPATAQKDVEQTLMRLVVTYGQSVEVSINTDGTVFTRAFFGEQYTALMSANPEWARGKPEGVFRPEDIFAFIDYLEAQ
jgi:hypothetical protein